MAVRRVAVVVAVVLCLLAATFAVAGIELGDRAVSAPVRVVAASSKTPIHHLWIVMMENTDWSAIKGSESAPYINRTLLPAFAHAENYRAHMHNSLPNYLLLEAGDAMGQEGLSPKPTELRLGTTDHLSTYLSRAGVRWKSYRESLPGNGTTCPLSDPGAPYSADHNAPVYFKDFTGRACIAHERPLGELARDLAGRHTPQYSFIVPNDYHQGEKPDPAAGADLVRNADRWLQGEIELIQHSAAYRRDGAILALWDEGAACCDNPSGLIAVSRFSKRGYASSTAYSHPSTLRTVQDVFGLRPYLRQAGGAPNLQDLFRVNLTARPRG
jgi:phosphatidylinositol-3-phosphatase